MKIEGTNDRPYRYSREASSCWSRPNSRMWNYHLGNLRVRNSEKAGLRTSKNVQIADQRRNNLMGFKSDLAHQSSREFDISSVLLGPRSHRLFSAALSSRHLSDHLCLAELQWAELGIAGQRWAEMGSSQIIIVRRQRAPGFQMIRCLHAIVDASCDGLAVRCSKRALPHPRTVPSCCSPHSTVL